MSNPERITPLPWKLREGGLQWNSITAGYSIAIESGEKPSDSKFSHKCVVGVFKPREEHWSPVDGIRDELPMLANAEYIVHACNTLPKLSALNAELVEALEECLYLSGFHDKDKDDTKFYTEARALIAKAKGGSNG